MKKTAEIFQPLHTIIFILIIPGQLKILDSWYFPYSKLPDEQKTWLDRLPVLTVLRTSFAGLEMVCKKSSDWLVQEDLETAMNLL